jgi:hypothetical protein
MFAVHHSFPTTPRQTTVKIFHDYAEAQELFVAIIEDEDPDLSQEEINTFLDEGYYIAGNGDYDQEIVVKLEKIEPT